MTEKKESVIGRLLIGTLAGVCVTAVSVAGMIGVGPLEGQAVRGKVAVLDIADAIPQATVFLVEPTGKVHDAVMTDSLGRFFVRASEAGTYIVRVNRWGYEPTSSSPLALIEGRIVEVRVNLRPDKTKLEAVTVFGSRFSPGQLEFLSRDTLEDRLYFRFDQKRMEELHASSPLGLMGALPFQYKCMTWWLDGWVVRDFGPNYPIDWVYGVEVFMKPWEVPPKYRGNALCGAILIWSRPIGQKY